MGPLHHVVEFRHETGVNEDVLALLSTYGVGLCLHDMPGGPTGAAARAVTGDVIYVRFHGATHKYSGRYGDAGSNTPLTVAPLDSRRSSRRAVYLCKPRVCWPGAALAWPLLYQ